MRDPSVSHVYTCENLYVLIYTSKRIDPRWVEYVFLEIQKSFSRRGLSPFTADQFELCRCSECVLRGALFVVSIRISYVTSAVYKYKMVLKKSLEYHVLKINSNRRKLIGDLN